LLAPRPTPNLEDDSFVGRPQLFIPNLEAVSSIRNPWMLHAMVTGYHINTERGIETDNYYPQH